MSLKPNYLEERICLNVLANSVENAQACYEAAEGHVVLGVLSKNYETDEAAIDDMKNTKQQPTTLYLSAWGLAILIKVKWWLAYQKFYNRNT